MEGVERCGLPGSGDGRPPGPGSRSATTPLRGDDLGGPPRLRGRRRPVGPGRSGCRGGWCPRVAPCQPRPALRRGREPRRQLKVQGQVEGAPAAAQVPFCPGGCERTGVRQTRVGHVSYIPGFHAWPGGPPIAWILEQQRQAQVIAAEAERQMRELLLLLLPLR